MRFITEYQFLRFFMPAYFAVILMYFYLKARSFKKKHNINPIVEGKADQFQKTILQYKIIIFIVLLLTVFLYSVFSKFYWIVIPFVYMETVFFKLSGIIILLLSSCLVSYSQSQLKSSWRVGVNPEEDAHLITNGIYGISRNPIALGMLLMLFGFFLVLPNAISFAGFWTGIVLANLRIRIEEEYLSKTLGKEYNEYCKKTRKWF